VEQRTVIASRPLARVSLKDSNTLFSHIRSKPVRKAKNLLNQLVERKKNIGGKYYPTASKEILQLIRDCEANAEYQGLNTNRLFIKHAQANEAFRFILPKSRWSHRGREAKICSLKIELEER